MVPYQHVIIVCICVCFLSHFSASWVQAQVAGELVFPGLGFVKCDKLRKQEVEGISKRSVL